MFPCSNTTKPFWLPPDSLLADVLHGEGGVLPQLLGLLLWLAPGQDAVHWYWHQLDLNLVVRGSVVLQETKTLWLKQVWRTQLLHLIKKTDLNCNFIVEKSKEYKKASCNLQTRTKWRRRQLAFTHSISQVRAPDHGAAFLAHFQWQRGRRVPLRPVAPVAQHHHLHYCGRHGHAVANGEGDGVVLVGESGVPVEQNVAGDVTESEGVAWRDGEGVNRGVCILLFIYFSNYCMSLSICRSTFNSVQLQVLPSLFRAAQFHFISLSIQLKNKNYMTPNIWHLLVKSYLRVPVWFDLFADFQSKETADLHEISCSTNEQCEKCSKRRCVCRRVLKTRGCRWSTLRQRRGKWQIKTHVW